MSITSKRSPLQVGALLLTLFAGVAGAYLSRPAHGPKTPSRQKPQLPLVAPAAAARPNTEAAPEEVQQVTTLKEGWARLTGAEFCFFGRNMYSARRASSGGETGGPFRPDGWLPSLRTDEREGVEFLIGQIPDKSLTRAHVDPFGVALKGELAVYCLQQIMKVNWYELKAEYKERLDRAVARDPAQSQAVLQRIIRSRSGSRELTGLWSRRYAESRRPPPPSN